MLVLPTFVFTRTVHVLPTFAFTRTIHMYFLHLRSPERYMCTSYICVHHNSNTSYISFNRMASLQPASLHPCIPISVRPTNQYPHNLPISLRLVNIRATYQYLCDLPNRYPIDPHNLPTSARLTNM